MAIIEQTGVLKQVDDEGNVVVLYPAVKTDSTLLESGAPADAAAVGEALKNVKPADSSVTLTQVEYDALSDEEKNNGTTYFISDANGECDATQVSFTSSNYTATNVAGALEEVNSSLKANNKQFYFDYKDGKYGYNTSSSRGADTFHPFSDSNGVFYVGTSTSSVDCTSIPDYQNLTAANFFLCPVSSYYSISKSKDWTRDTAGASLSYSKNYNQETGILTFTYSFRVWLLYEFDGYTEEILNCNVFCKLS